MVEGGFVVASVAVTDRAAADRFDELPIERRDDDPVMIAVGDVEPIGLIIGQHLAGKTQRSRLLIVGQQVEANGRFVHQLVLAIVR